MLRFRLSPCNEIKGENTFLTFLCDCNPLEYFGLVLDICMRLKMLESVEVGNYKKSLHNALL